MLQVRDKYYRIVKSLVQLLGSSMPPKPHKQAAIQALMLEHWDKVRTAHITLHLALSVQHPGLCFPTLALNELAC